LNKYIQLPKSFSFVFPTTALLTCGCDTSTVKFCY